MLAFALNHINLSIYFRPDGPTFKVGKESSNVTPREGDIVTFSFESYSRREIPVNPFVSRIRKDISWRDVLREHRRNKGM